ncbi:MAG TPA: SDR family oxidoreductase [Fimbriimonadaceae bacterium]|nr:SDR family oxidoreductase [Fimbriimonadaceae bacterium]
MTDSPFSLAGEIALITGGATGIGFGIARCMVEAGAKVVLVGRREAELAQAQQALGEAASYLVHDITELDKAGNLMQQAGPLSILVNNAGIHLKKLAVDTTPAEFDQVLQTHIVAAHALTAAALPAMIERKHGNILFTASMTSLFGMPKVVAYAAAKSAMLGMVRTLSTEVAAHGVRVNAIAPGWIETPMLHRALDNDPQRKNRILARTPMERFGQPEDIGWAAVYLCSPAASFLTGVVLPVDGGASIGF